MASSVTVLDVEESEALELDVPAPGASLPPNLVPVPGEEDAEDSMEVEQGRKRIRGCIDNGQNPLDLPETASSLRKKKVDAFFQPRAKAKIEPRRAPNLD
eukprot:5879483-Amphidinium_carterae.1